MGKRAISRFPFKDWRFQSTCSSKSQDVVTKFDVTTFRESPNSFGNFPRDVYMTSDYKKLSEPQPVCCDILYFFVKTINWDNELWDLGEGTWRRAGDGVRLKQIFAIILKPRELMFVFCLRFDIKISDNW